MRVIAGRYRGREVRAPRGCATRPTAQRARQALFDVLGDLSHQRVLDLYAGSGALGIEALSRGAVHAVFVEARRGALAVLRQNLARLDLEGMTTILGQRVDQAARYLRDYAPFDLVLCDPPWADLGAVQVTLAKMDWTGLLVGGATLVVEHPGQLPDALNMGSGLRVKDRRAWGDTGMTLYERERPVDR